MFFWLSLLIGNHSLIFSFNLIALGIITFYVRYIHRGALIMKQNQALSAMFKEFKLKVFISLLLLILTQTSFAGPSASVFHSHDGRIHQHPLPAQGLSHRHGSGGLGVIAKSTNYSPNITSSIVYGERPAIKRPPPSNTRRLDQVIPSQANSTNQKYLNNQKHNSILPRQGLSKGEIRCRMGQADCNVCAVNVQQQFGKAAARQINWRSKPWRFNWPQRYPPNNSRPLDIFDGVPAYALGIPDTHIQGFVRTNSARYPYAGSHSHKKRGGIFVVKQNSDGKKYLSSLHQTKGRHPSGVQVIGKYLVYGEGSRLIFKDLNSPNQQNNISLNIPKPGFGGGLAIFKLSRDKHLIVTSGPGGQDRRPRYHRFYKLKSINGRPTSIRFINQSSSRNPAKWPRGLNFSENLSLVTECGTGDIYAIHTSGDEKGISAISGNGYWRLSKLVDNHNKLSLNPISAFSNRQNMSSCNVRAAATVYVNQQNKLEFYCHGYAKDPDGSLFNVLGKSSRGVDKFKFKVGTVY